MRSLYRWFWYIGYGGSVVTCSRVQATRVPYDHKTINQLFSKFYCSYKEIAIVNNFCFICFYVQKAN